MKKSIEELKENLPRECCSFCTHLSLDGPNKDYKYDVKCVLLNSSPILDNNCKYFQAENSNLNVNNLDSSYISFLESCLRCNYDEYLKTIHWKLFKNYAIEKKENKCSVCGSCNNLDVYHINKHLGRETLEDVSVLCDKCL